MSDNYGDDNDRLKLNERERSETFTKEHKCTVNETSLKFQQLVSIFENEESETKFKSLSRRRSTMAAAAVAAVQAKEPEKAERADEADEVERADGAADVSSTDGSGRSDRAPAEAVPSGGKSSTAATCTSTVSVKNRGGGGWIEQPGRNLLFVIHPWCMLHKSAADRQSEFPPPGFLERLKAKLMALHRQSDEQQRHGPATAGRRRRHTHQRIKCWFQYTATTLGGGGGGGGGPTSMTTVHAAYPRNEPPAVVDFLSVWRRCANVAAACSATHRD